MHRQGFARTFASVVTVFSAVLMSSCEGAASPDPPDELAAAWTNRVEQPNIILILVDTLRKDRLGFYGHDRNTSPNLDRLAGTSVVYENAFSQAPWTLPSVAAMLTSQYPSALGIENFRRRIPDSAVFLQEILSDHGYTTHAIVSHTFIGSQWGFDRGFDTFESFAGGHRVVTSEAVTEAALQIVDQMNEQPTFLMVHYFDPHYLFIEHEDFRFSGTPPEAESEWWVMPHRQLNYRAYRGMISAAQRDYLFDLYDSEIAYTDFHIGRLLDRLASAGLLDSSIVIFTSDHGEEFMDHDGMGHGTKLFNELINVPLVIKWPGSSDSIRSRRNVALVDLLPTLLDYLDIALHPDVAGVHLRDRDSQQPIISENRRHRDFTAVIQDRSKLIYNAQTETIDFFDLESDSLELEPLDRIGASEWLLAELESFRDRYRTEDAQQPTGDEVEITEEQRRQLEALGYVD